MIEKNFEIKKENGMIIRGKEFFSTDEKLIPIVFAHGFTANMLTVINEAKALAEIGYHTFIFDFCGGGFETISDGDFHTYMTPITELEDLEDVIHFVLQKENVLQDKLIIFGCSQGGFVSAMYASQHSDIVDQLILYYPAFCIPDDARRGQMQVITFDPNNIGESVGEGRMRVSGEYPKSVLYIQFEDTIKDYQKKVLLIHGSSDEIVPIHYADKAKQVYGDTCTYHVIEGGDHGFRNPTHRALALEYVKQFLNNK